MKPPCSIESIMGAAFLLSVYLMAFQNVGGWLSALIVISCLFSILAPVRSILRALFGTVRLRITQAEIVLTYEVLGLRFLRSLSAPRQNIMKIELTRLSHEKGSNRYKIAVPSQLDIWAGTKKFPLGGDDSLTAPELDWLAQILSNWLNLPIT